MTRKEDRRGVSAALAILEAVHLGSKTVPDIAARTGMSQRLAHYHVTKKLLPAALLRTTHVVTVFSPNRRTFRRLALTKKGRRYLSDGGPRASPRTGSRAPPRSSGRT